MGKKIFFAQGKYRVRWKNNAVFSLEKNVLDRIPLYKRTVLKEECLYFIPEKHGHAQHHVELTIYKDVLCKTCVGWPAKNGSAKLGSVVGLN